MKETKCPENNKIETSKGNKSIIKQGPFKFAHLKHSSQKRIKILEVNNIDLPGRRFNGFDLQRMINNDTIHSAKQIVTTKTSDDKNVIELFKTELGLKRELKLLESEASILSVHSQLSFASNLLKNNRDFINADLVHYHLIHNTKLSLYQMIDLCKDKPSILTIHDPWIFTGRCVYPQECEKWNTGCKKCEYLSNLFPLKEDNCNSLWNLKKKVYENLDIDIVVTTPFMLNMVRTSPLTKHFKNVHLLPFGIDLNKFNNTISREEARKALNINQDDIVLFFRAQMAMKGTEYIIEALKKMRTKQKVTLLTCSETGLLTELSDRYNIIDLGHIEDDMMVIAYNACDIFLMPSRGESFGLMAIEAMACSRPVVIFDNSALPDVTFAPQCGALVKNKNSIDLMRVIKRLINNSEEREKRGSLGRTLAEQNYNIDVYNKNIMKLYETAYERQKNKKSIKFKTNKINYELQDVQVLIGKLRDIFKNVFEGRELNARFVKREHKISVSEGKKIDYACESVQNVIQQFNDYIYKTLNSEESKNKNKAEISDTKINSIFNRKINRTELKEIVKNKLENHKSMYFLARYTYKVLRRIKRTIFNDYYKNLSQYNQQLQNQVSVLKDEIGLIEKKNETLVNEMHDLNKQFKMIEDANALEYKNIFYYHGGSGNHGCEALIRTIVGLGNFKREDNCLCSYVADEDVKFGINKIVKYIKQSKQDTEELKGLTFSHDAIAFSIGGDNYCGYDYGTKRLAKYNEMFNTKGVKTALIGCSIEPDVLEHQEVLDDLNRFSLITARESITYNALLAKGINRNTHYIPDSAFILEPTYLPLPNGFEEGNTIGINISNLVQSYDKRTNLTYENFKNLIKYIIDSTRYKIALIPHVIQPHNDDLGTLQKLYSEFKDSDRVIMINECNCNVIKGYISRCKMLVCARTHASIAAYSTCVPTLVLGYSVKSRGIATDIFGTDENYVLPVNNLEVPEDLTKAFKWLEKQYSKIKQHLEAFMPDYCKRCYALGPLLEDLRKNGETAKLALANPSLCTGCGACKLVCPKKCIEMEPNSEGFLYPKTDYTKCINCDLCRKLCPINNNIFPKKHGNVYAATNEHINTRLKSSSGGIFSLLSEQILKSGGVVFGAGYDENNNVCHMSINNIGELYRLIGSKYVQSELKDSYVKVKELLSKNVNVLFSGTPCQILGLKQYLNMEYDNLLCVDVICHGVPSPKVFKKYCMKLEKDAKSEIASINFRDKSSGWRLFNMNFTFKDGKTLNKVHIDDVFMKGFLKNLFLRKSCYNCPANDFRSGSDITLGDYWGVEDIHPELDDNNGVSLILVNTKKGKILLNQIEKEIKLIKSDIDFVIKRNSCIIESVKCHYNRDSFFNDIDNTDIVDLINEKLK